MSGAGDYSARLTLRRRSVSKNADNGQDEEAFTDAGQLWGAVEPTAGRRQTDYGARQTGADATVRIRNYPAVSALDRLYWDEYETLYVIDHVRYGVNELVCECFLFDNLALEDE